MLVFPYPARNESHFACNSHCYITWCPFQCTPDYSVTCHLIPMMAGGEGGRHGQNSSVSDTSHDEINAVIREQIHGDFLGEIKTLLCKKVRSSIQEEIKDNIRAEMQAVIKVEVSGRLECLKTSLQQMAELSQDMAAVKQSIDFTSQKLDDLHCSPRSGFPHRAGCNIARHVSTWLHHTSSFPMPARVISPPAIVWPRRTMPGSSSVSVTLPNATSGSAMRKISEHSKTLSALGPIFPQCFTLKNPNSCIKERPYQLRLRKALGLNTSNNGLILNSLYLTLRPSALAHPKNPLSLKSVMGFKPYFLPT